MRDHGGMVLKLDARFPLVWRSPSDMQFGVDPPRLVLRDVTSAQELLIASLVPGISRSGLSMIANSGGASEDDITSLLAVLAPILIPSPVVQTSTQTPIAMVGSGPTVERIARVLMQGGQRVVVATAATTTPGVSSGDNVGGRDIKLGIAVGHFVLDPDVYGYWLRRDIPHLPIVFGDSSVTIGPFIEPGIGPCLYCLERYRSEADPVWPTLAAQLWRRRSHSETPLLSREVTARVGRLVVNRLTDARPGPAVSVRLDAVRGTATYREELPHPLCGCREVPSAARPGIDLPDAPALDVLPRRTKIRRVAGGRG
jgi:bacteriocin biosynthesis cyclodehydratase domain-containing protein